MRLDCDRTTLGENGRRSGARRGRVLGGLATMLLLSMAACGPPAGSGGPGGAGPSKEYFTGLGEMYVSDERFAANYGGPAGAAFVRAALLAYADRNL